MVISKKKQENPSKTFRVKVSRQRMRALTDVGIFDTNSSRLNDLVNFKINLSI